MILTHHFLIGAVMALVFTLFLAKVTGFGFNDSGSGFSSGWGLAFWFLKEVVLVAVFLGVLIGTAIVGSPVAWNLVGGWALVRAIAIGCELASSK